MGTHCGVLMLTLIKTDVKFSLKSNSVVVGLV